ncbi:type II toxin-antitoxin system VapC family toxin [Mycobacterium ostraviense]|uniref:type II toxin-antitoxin system VapC family toxin n=1 Tax=Mycobacterium ostraviense TaxID=2738409 RepID=UPI00278C7342|nr:type II toxin-antitoxin system VapC family toxin [Mycobacterium ostraviense]
MTAGSAWEIGIKTRLGRLDGDALLSTWSEVIADMSASELAIDSQDGILAARLPWEHRDPFDRVVVAQALRRNLTIATRDVRILQAALTPTMKV